MASFHALQKTFMSSPHFAVVGASKDPSKFGFKVLDWYKTRHLDVTPVHPKESELSGFTTIKSLAELPAPTKTSVSIITPPKVTLSVVQEAKDLNIPALWIQPGAEDNAVLDYIKNNGLEKRVIFGGPCVLAEGDKIRSLL